MHILIYRQKKKDVVDVCNYLLKLLTDFFGTNNVKLCCSMNSIRLFDNIVYIDFHCGDILKMRGYRPDYYNTDSFAVDRFIEQSCTKTSGKYLNKVDDIPSVILSYLF